MGMPMTEKINLNDLRIRRGVYYPLIVVCIKRAELGQVDLATVARGDWIDGVADLNDPAIIGFLHQLARVRIRLVPEDE